MFSQRARSIAIQQGPKFENLGIALLVLAVGVGIGVLGALGNVTLSIGRLSVPGWSMYAAAALAVLVSAAIAAVSLSAERCTGCGKRLAHGEAYFPLDWERHVVKAVELGVPYALAGAPMVSDQETKLALEMSYCPGCAQVGKLSATKWYELQPEALIDERMVSGEAAALFSQIVLAHGAWRITETEALVRCPASAALCPSDRGPAHSTLP